MSHEAVETARWALEEFGEGDVGQHLGIVMTGAVQQPTASQRMYLAIPAGNGTRLWPAHQVRAITIELALVPAAQALVAPQWVPWSDRIQSGDLGQVT